MSEQIVLPQAEPPKTGKTAVSVHDGLVILHFERGCEYAVYAPLGAISDGAKMILAASEADRTVAQTAINVAMAIVDGIYEARGDLKPAGSAIKHELIERHRRTLTKRVEVMLNSLRERKTTSNQGLAKQVVEAMLKEVFT